MHVLILGANSDIAHALARLFAEREGAHIVLASRNMEKLERAATDIRERHQVRCEALAFDAADFNSHPEFYASLDPKPDVVVVAFGYLGDQQKGQADFAEAKKIIDANYTGAVSVCEIAAADLAAKGRGSIIGVSSVAGQRGKMSNYLYGSAKAGFTCYLSGLRQRMYLQNVHVLTVLPGFVRTAMTADMDLPPALTAPPEQAARDIHRAYRKRKSVIHTRWFWRWIMEIVCAVPEFMFKKKKM